VGKIIKYLLLSIAAVLGLAIASVVVVFAYLAFDEYRFVWRSPLAAGLPPEFGVADSVFQKRVRERFPLGSSAVELVKELEREGFTSNNAFGDSFWQRDAVAWPNTLFLTPGPGWSFPCRLVWIVVWNSDAAAQITAIDANYHGICL